MKVRQYLTEELVDKKHEIIKKLQKDCKPWLKESKGLPGWRASREQLPSDLNKLSVRSNRFPLTTNHEMHDIVDKIFLDKFGWRARTNVLFIQGSYTINPYYGKNKYAIYPIGSFKYLWSNQYNDLGPYLDSVEMHSEDREDDEGNSLSPDDEEKLLTKDLKTVIEKGKYKTTGLHQALSIKSGHEIMVNCKNYYAIPSDAHFAIYKEMHGAEAAQRLQF